MALRCAVESIIDLVESEKSPSNLSRTSTIFGRAFATVCLCALLQEGKDPMVAFLVAGLSVGQGYLGGSFVPYAVLVRVKVVATVKRHVLLDER
jgi:hypothetical protein